VKRQSNNASYVQAHSMLARGLIRQ